MNAPTKAVMLALGAALIMIGPASAETGEGADAGPCQTFEYTLDPPAYYLRPECIPLPMPRPPSLP